MDWLAFLGALVSIANAVAKYLGNKQLIDAGKAEAVSTQLQGALDAIRSAQAVKVEVDARTAGPDASAKLRDDPANLYRD